MFPHSWQPRPAKQDMQQILHICDISAKAAVDLLFNDGKYVICEVNSSPGFEGMDKFTKTNVAEDIVTYVKHKIGYSDNRNET